MKASSLALVLALGVIAAPASAKDRSWKIGADQYHVYYRDLDIGTAAGRAAMLNRIDKAAVKLCADLIAIDRRRCVDDTMRMTIRARNGGMLRVALQERTRSSLAAR